MKLGTETGSMTNWIYSRAVKGQPEPTVGMGVTFLHWTDRSPGTITKVFKIGQCMAIEVQADNYERTDRNGFSEDQQYTYSPNPDGAKSTFIFRANRWRGVRFNKQTKRWKNTDSGCGLGIGYREAYWDPCF